jgi:hypothetical protein
MKPATLKVLANPYFALDANGMPAAMCRWDPEVGRPGAVEFIGVTIARKQEPFEERSPFRKRATPRRPAKLVYAQTPVEIPLTPMHRDYVRQGALLAADQPTARACLIFFVPPANALAQAKAQAIAQYRASNGQDPPVEQWEGAVKGPPARLHGPPLPAPDPQELFFASPFAPTSNQGKVS